jgi:hypothetical protein
MKQIVFIVFLVSSKALFAQEDLNGLITKLQTSFSKVETASKTYEQEIKLLEYSSVRYSYNEVDQKGGKISYAAEFNLADIDPYTVRQETQKDIILVVLTAKNKQKLVKNYKNNEVQAYDNEVELHVKDVDKAREVVDIIKKAIPVGEKITAGKLKLKGYDEMVSWLIQNVKTVNLGSKSINQTIAKDTYIGSLKLTQISSDGKASHQEDFVFNLADINLNTINFKVSGNTFELEVETIQNQKIINLTRDGINKPFVSDFSFFANNVDEARDIKTVLTLVVPLAVAKVKADLPAPKTVDEALKTLASLTKDVKINDKTYAQAITPKCLTTFSLTEQGASTTVTNIYDFNWMDINPNGVKLQVSGERMSFELPINNNGKLIAYKKNDKLSFVDDADINVANFETGRRIKMVIEKVVESCKTSYKDPFANNTTAMTEWLKSKVGEVTVEQNTRKQNLDFAESGNNNKLKYTNIETKGSTSTEEVFEFNLSDINPNSVDYSIKGKAIFVSFETNFRNKIIKAYKAGKIQPYTYSLDLAFQDIETARGVISALKKCAENLKSTK